MRSAEAQRRGAHYAQDNGTGWKFCVGTTAHHRDNPVGLAAGAPLRTAADAGGGSNGRVLDQRSSDPVRKKPLQQGPA